jgi:hypothetical protein
MLEMRGKNAGVREEFCKAVATRRPEQGYAGLPAAALTKMLDPAVPEIEDEPP